MRPAKPVHVRLRCCCCPAAGQPQACAAACRDPRAHCFAVHWRRSYITHLRQLWLPSAYSTDSQTDHHLDRRPPPSSSFISFFHSFISNLPLAFCSPHPAEPDSHYFIRQHSIYCRVSHSFVWKTERRHLSKVSRAVIYRHCDPTNLPSFLLCAGLHPSLSIFRYRLSSTHSLQSPVSLFYYALFELV